MIRLQWTDFSQDHPEDVLYPDPRLRAQWRKKTYTGGLFSYSEIGGDSLSLQNPWQGSQLQAKSEQP